MIRSMLLLLLLASCATTHNFTNIYKNEKCGPVSVTLWMNNDLSEGDVHITVKGIINSVGNKFKVKNISKDKGKLHLVKVNEKFPARLEGEINSDTITNFRSMIKNATLWQCNLTKI